ncbi:MAG: hypothetical protein LIP01_16055 [Tannerellaceae bacterium]|nr:hypothetical protein [Tannerellaceae bacterium]
MKNFIAVLLLIHLSACIGGQQNRLQFALEFAGENRSELEKVLQYYKDDEEKYKAACFLIENMPQWYGYEGWALDSLHTIIAKAYKEDYLPASVYREWSSFPFYSFPKVYDSHIITAGYLINNIDLAFEVWKKYPWNQYLNFDDFCELILPYRLGDEPLSD